MKWDMSLWNYHKLALLTSLFVFILLCPPVYTYFQRGTSSQLWLAFLIALLVWSFIFIMLHVYSGKSKFSQSVDDLN